MTGRSFTPTPEQTTIIKHAGSAFISACPGAGKTRVMVERARHILRNEHSGRGVAFLSFTNAAVSELEVRLRHDGLLASPPFPHFIGTFDSFIWHYLIAPFGIPNCTEAPRLIPDKDGLMVQPFAAARPLPLACFDRTSGAVIPAVAQRLGYDPSGNAGIAAAYVTAARNLRAQILARAELDFEDVRSVAKRRLADTAFSVRLGAILAARFCEVIVDEAQDCNPADLEVIGWLRNVGIVTKVICDPHQSIYAFRGGVTEQLLAFRDTFAPEDRLPMNGNFRSSSHICKAIVGLRKLDSRTPVDQALGEHKDEPTHVHLLSYKGQTVPSTIGVKFQELVTGLKLEIASSPVLAATRASGARAVGQPPESTSQDLLMCLAQTITDFHFCSEIGNRKSALEDIHKIVVKIEGRLNGKSYHQYLKDENVSPDTWRPRILQLARELRFEASIFANADAWHAKAKELIAPTCDADGPTINQRLKKNASLATALAVPAPTFPSARTIHSVKGQEFSAVCVVMTPTTATGIMDYLENGQRSEHAEDAREIYVAASRAERLLAIAVPKSQADRMAAHLRAAGADITVVVL